MSNILRSYIIEDEKANLDSLVNLLDNYCDNIEIVGTAECVEDSIKEIKKLNPNIIFLDINLPKGSGFTLFDYFSEPEFFVIFTTAHVNYAVDAFNTTAVHFLAKPVEISGLKKSIQKVEELIEEKKNFSHVKIIAGPNIATTKIALPAVTGLHYVPLEEIVWVEAQSNYSVFHLVNGKNLLVSKTLKLFEKPLKELNFFRLNRSSIVNISHILYSSRHQKVEVTLTGDIILTLSEKRKQEFKNLFE